jgi:hypothetical protein
VEGFAQLDAFDDELNVLEARSAAREQQLKECEERFAGVLPKRNELYRRLPASVPIRRNPAGRHRSGPTMARSKEAKARPEKGKSSKAPKRQVREIVAWIWRLWACCEHYSPGSSSAPSSLWIHWKTIGVLAASMVDRGWLEWRLLLINDAFGSAHYFLEVLAQACASRMIPPLQLPECWYDLSLHDTKY